MSTVTEVRVFRGVARLSFDDASPLKVRLKHFEAFPLAVGDDVDVEQYARRVAEAQRADAYEAALNSLDLCARTRQELRRSLLARGFVSAAVEATLDRLADSGLIDDRRYAERAVEMSAARPVGVYAMRRKLRAKGIGEEDAEAALNMLDDEQQAQAAQAAARSLLRKYASLPAREGRAKLSQALARRGFSWEAVRAAVDAVWEADEWDD